MTLDDRLEKIFEELSRIQGISFDEAVAKFVGSHGEFELNRFEPYSQLQALLKKAPTDGKKLCNHIQKESVLFLTGGVLGGSRYSRPRMVALLENEQTAKAVDQLLGVPRRVPAKGDIESFVERAGILGMSSPDGKADKSYAALFASVLLTAMWPDEFVDFRQNRWKWFASQFGLEDADFQMKSIPNYGDKLFWAGDVAKRFAESSFFKRHLAIDKYPDLWTVAGIVFQLHSNPFNGDKHRYKELVESVMAGESYEPLVTAADESEDPMNKLINEALALKPQIVLYGPPGSGKTFAAKSYLEYLAEDSIEIAEDSIENYQLECLNKGKDGNQLFSLQNGDDESVAAMAKRIQKLECPLVWDIVQFHPGYSYEDFVRGLVARPTPEGEAVIFQAENRKFTQMAQLAKELEESGIDFYLILDEINRSDISKVLGELVYALEYRGETVSIQYPLGGSTMFSIPENLYLIGTMNTADRSIAMVDYAIRRRFAFLRVSSKADAIRGFYSDPDQHCGSAKAAKQVLRGAVALFEVVQALFENVENRDDYMVGHSYFMATGEDVYGENLQPQEWAEKIGLKFALETIPLLREYEKEGILRDIQRHDWGFVLSENAMHLRSTVADWILKQNQPA